MRHVKSYDIVFNNCQILINHVLDEILLETGQANRKSTALQAVNQVGNILSSSLPGFGLRTAILDILQEL
jgi:hypothetical protein